MGGLHINPPSIFFLDPRLTTIRSKTLIDSLFSLGICLPYSRVLEITKDIGIKTLKKYEINDCFVPDYIKNGIFTVVAKDNIDLNAQCTIVKSHFHGISMSILQFPPYFNLGQSQEYNIVEDFRFWTIVSFSEALSLSLLTNIRTPCTNIVDCIFMYFCKKSNFSHFC